MKIYRVRIAIGTDSWHECGIFSSQGKAFHAIISQYYGQIPDIIEKDEESIEIYFPETEEFKSIQALILTCEIDEWNEGF